MKRTFYVKEGRRYRAVSEYDSDLMSALPQGCHLIHVHPGGTSTLCRVDPQQAPVLAALHELEEDLRARLSEALKPQLGTTYQRRPISPRASQLWAELQKEIGDESPAHHQSIYGTVQAALEGVKQRALKGPPCSP